MPLSRASWLPRVSTIAVCLSLLLRRCRMLLGGGALLGLLLGCGLSGGALLGLLLRCGLGGGALLGLLLGCALGGGALLGLLLGCGTLLRCLLDCALVWTRRSLR